MAEVLKMRKSEEPRHQCRNGYMEWYEQKEAERAERARVEANYRAMQLELPEEVLARVRPSLIDKLMPYIMIIGFLAIFLIGGSYLVEWLSNVGR